MLRTALVACLLTLLALGYTPATARPAARTWWFWLAKPERHGSRKMPGDFRPVYGTYRNHSHDRAGRRTMAGNFKPNYATYRYHSRERRGLFSFLHFGSRQHEARSHRQSQHDSAAPSRSRMTL